MRGVASSAAVPGFEGVPRCGFRPTPENANSVMCVWPVRAAPARRRRATTGASAVAAGRSRSTTEPAVVGKPATSNKSLMLTARPASGGSGMPARCCRSMAAAVASAWPVKRRT